MAPRSLLCALLLPLSLYGAHATSISLDQPVSASLQPDILYWNFDDGVIGTSWPDPVPDRSPTKANGILIPKGMTPTYTPGRFGTGLLTTLEPGHAAYIRWQSVGFPAATFRDTLGLEKPGFTLGGWVKVNYTPESKAASITVLQGMQTNIGVIWTFNLVKNAQEAWTLLFVYNGVRYDLGVPMDSFMQGEWHHVAVSVGKGEDGTPTVTFWNDGYAMGDPKPLDPNAVSKFKDEERLILTGASGLEGVVDDLFITRGVHTFTPPRTAWVANNASGH